MQNSSSSTKPRSKVLRHPGARPSGIHRIWRDHGLSIVLIVLFVVTFAGQTLAGWRVYNDEQHQHGMSAITLGEYVRTGHYGEATFENWESEFLQMAFFVLLTATLYQRGSSESKRPDVVELVDLDPRDSADQDEAPWPVRRGGWILRLYEHSLSITFALLFLFAFGSHAWSGMVEYNQEQLTHGEPTVTLVQFLTTAQFWFESLQNWQSEFLALVAMVVLSIFLRQRGSPESKPVAAPTWDTGK